MAGGTVGETGIWWPLLMCGGGGTGMHRWSGTGRERRIGFAWTWAAFNYCGLWLEDAAHLSRPLYRSGFTVSERPGSRPARRTERTRDVYQRRSLDFQTIDPCSPFPFLVPAEPETWQLW